MARLPRLALACAALAALGCQGATSAAPDGGALPDASQGDGPAALDPTLFDPGLAGDDAFQLGNPDPTALDVAALQALIAEADQLGSDSLIVARDHTIVAERYFGKQPKASTIQSVTKSVTSLAVGALVDDGTIQIDQPVGDFYPEWQQGGKAPVTIRMLLTMTSGLADSADLFNQNDSLAWARMQPLVSPPGTTFYYSNTGVQLFSGIVEQAAGMPADQFVRQRFFLPIGITGGSWAHDPAGNVATPGGLFLAPRDLLRLGLWVEQRGAWGGMQLVSTGWIDESQAPEPPAAPCYGLLWWLDRTGCGDSWTPPYGPERAFYALGWGGQYIVVVPSAHLIGVRTRFPPASLTLAEEQAVAMPDFPDGVASLPLP